MNRWEATRLTAWRCDALSSVVVFSAHILYIWSDWRWIWCRQSFGDKNLIGSKRPWGTEIILVWNHYSPNRYSFRSLFSLNCQWFPCVPLVLWALFLEDVLSCSRFLYFSRGFMGCGWTLGLPLCAIRISPLSRRRAEENVSSTQCTDANLYSSWKLPVFEAKQEIKSKRDWALASKLQLLERRHDVQIATKSHWNLKEIFENPNNVFIPLSFRSRKRG